MADRRVPLTTTRQTRARADHQPILPPLPAKHVPERTLYRPSTLSDRHVPERTLNRSEMQLFNHSSHHFQSEIFYLIQRWKGGRLQAAPLLDWLTHKIFFRTVRHLILGESKWGSVLPCLVTSVFRFLFSLCGIRRLVSLSQLFKNVLSQGHI